MKKILLPLLLVSFTVGASVFWRRTVASPPSSAPWPASLPVFGGDRTVFSLESASGMAFAHQLVSADPESVLTAVCAAYRRDGWDEAPVQTCDMRMFSHGENGVAAVLVEGSPDGTRVTVVQRNRE